MMDSNGGGGSWMWLVGALCLIVIVGVIAWIMTTRRSDVGSGTGGSRQDPEKVLGERFARGEIDQSEYQQRLDVLRGHAQVADER